MGNAQRSLSINDYTNTIHFAQTAFRTALEEFLGSRCQTEMPKAHILDMGERIEPSPPIEEIMKKCLEKLSLSEIYEEFKDLFYKCFHEFPNKLNNITDEEEFSRQIRKFLTDLEKFLNKIGMFDWSDRYYRMLNLL